MSLEDFLIKYLGAVVVVIVW